MSEQLILVLLIIVLIQSVFSVLQVRYYNRFIADVKKRYSNTQGFFLDIDREKNFLGQTVILLVTKRDGTVAEAYEYSGISVFAKPREITALIGRNVHEDGLIQSAEKLSDRAKTIIERIRHKIIQQRRKNAD